MGTKECQENIPTSLKPHHQHESLIQGRIEPRFHVVYIKFRPCYLKVGVKTGVALGVCAGKSQQISSF